MADVTRGLTARIIREGAGDDCVFIAEHGFYCYMTNAGTPAAMLQVVLQKAAKEIASYDYENGHDFEEGVLEDLKKAGAPGAADIACVFNKHGKLFLMSRQKGEVFIQRGGNTARLLHGDKHAVGTLQDEDIFILTTSESSAALQSMGGWNAYLGGADISGRDLSGLILTTSVVEAEGKEERVERRAAPQHVEPEEKKERKPPAWLLALRGLDRRRLLILGGIAIAGVLLVLSLAFGLIRRANDNRLKQIAYTKEEVTQKLRQAEDVAFLNSGRAAGLINDAKRDVTELKEQIGDDDSKEMKELDALITQTESAIFKKEEKQPEEFFDLAIENKNARGKFIARNADRVAILNPDGTVYLLNLEKKSLDRYSSGVKNAIGVAVGESAVFIVSNDGIVQVDAEGKAKKVLDKDKEWSSVSSIASFNNNIYVLDGGKGIIHKYTPTEAGYGGRSSYLQGNGPSLVGAKSIAIDASIYVSSDSSIYKYTAGLQDGFAPQFPEGGTSITKIDSAEDVEKVYAWDKPRGLLYIISKNGSYERQIKSPAFKAADDLVVTSDFAYLLQGQKIYQISLD